LDNGTEYGGRVVVGQFRGGSKRAGSVLPRRRSEEETGKKNKGEESMGKKEVRKENPNENSQMKVNKRTRGRGRKEKASEGDLSQGTCGSKGIVVAQKPQEKKRGLDEGATFGGTESLKRG